MNLGRHIARQNQILRTEIGETTLYTWQYSESLLHWRAKINDDGTPIHKYRCPCGVDRNVHAPSCNGIIVAEQVYERVKLRPDLTDQWVLCVRILNPEPWIWRALYGSHLPYEKVNWAPVSSLGGGTVACPRGEIPQEDTTWLVVRMIRDHRSRSIKSWDEETKDGMDRREKKERETLYDMIRDSMGISDIPGKKENMSFPTPGCLYLPDGTKHEIKEAVNVVG